MTKCEKHDKAMADQRQMAAGCTPLKFQLGNTYLIPYDSATQRKGELRCRRSSSCIKTRKGAFRFRLKAANGEIILASQGYQRKSNAMNGIESVRRNALDNSRYEVKAAKGGQRIFNLKAANAKVIGTSQRYKTKAGRIMR